MTRPMPNYWRDAPADDREAALKSGTTRYRSVPCKHGHVGIRFTHSQQCVICVQDEITKNAGKRLYREAPTSKMIEIDRKLEDKNSTFNYYEEI